MAKKKEVLEVTQLPDVFDEDSSTMAKPVVIHSDDQAEKISASVAQVDQEDEKLPSPRPPRIVTEVEEEELVVPTEPEAKEEMPPASEPLEEPTFTVRQNGQTVEQKLPAFFVDGSESVSSEKPQDEALPVEPQSQETQALEAAVPQAFVSEVRQVATEVKRERKGTLVTIFIIFGMILVAGGVLGLFVMNTRKQNGAQSTPEPTAVVEATPEPTPTVIINTGDMGSTASVSAEVKKEVKVNVLNGTAIKGLANKEAAILRKNDFTIGTVGNGDPAKAGTIVVPTGRLDMGEEIKSLLTDITFTVTEDAEVTAITVTLGEPTAQ